MWVFLFWSVVVSINLKTSHTSKPIVSIFWFLFFFLIDKRIIFNLKKLAVVALKNHTVQSLLFIMDCTVFDSVRTLLFFFLSHSFQFLKKQKFTKLKACQCQIRSLTDLLLLHFNDKDEQIIVIYEIRIRLVPKVSNLLLRHIFLFCIDVQ